MVSVSRMSTFPRGYDQLKRFLDLIVALFILVVTAVPLCFIALLVVFSTKGPAIYWSERMGKRGAIFRMPKFRTMKIDTPLLPTDKLQRPDQYITSVGHFLRKTSLDELPQLYCVVVGDMSLVGPRPVLPSQTELIDLRNSLGVDVLRPGITGWAQINGRDDLDVGRKARYDAEYLERRTVFFDFYILWKTVFYVLKSQGVHH